MGDVYTPSDVRLQPGKILVSLGTVLFSTHNSG
jgi:hypothetical protein